MCIGRSTFIHLVTLEFLTNVYFAIFGAKSKKTILAKNTFDSEKN